MGKDNITSDSGLLWNMGFLINIKYSRILWNLESHLFQHTLAGDVAGFFVPFFQNLTNIEKSLSMFYDSVLGGVL